MALGIISKQEKYIAASGYLFELGYAISWLTQTESEFTKFHLDQENRIIKLILLPGLVILFLGILWQNSASKYLIYLGGIVIIASLVMSLVGAISALRGTKKKIL